MFVNCFIKTFGFKISKKYQQIHLPCHKRYFIKIPFRTIEYKPNRKLNNIDKCKTVHNQIKKFTLNHLHSNTMIYDFTLSNIKINNNLVLKSFCSIKCKQYLFNPNPILMNHNLISKHINTHNNIFPMMIIISASTVFNVDQLLCNTIVENIQMNSLSNETLQSIAQNVLNAHNDQNVQNTIIKTDMINSQIPCQMNYYMANTSEPNWIVLFYKFCREFMFESLKNFVILGIIFVWVFIFREFPFIFFPVFLLTCFVAYSNMYK